MLMPKAPVHEQRYPTGTKNEIWLSGQISGVQPVTAWACNDCQKCRFQTRICPCGQFSGRCLSPWWFGLATGGYSAASHFR
jgi:hypothetical protein